MTRIKMMDVLGVDFGTTNTVVAARGRDGAVTVQRFDYEDGGFSAFRSVLAFWSARADGAGPAGRTVLGKDAGPWAIRRFLDQPEDTRFLQSFKTFAASPSFDQTTVFGTRFRFEDLLAAFFERVRAHAGGALERLPSRLVLGRPVAFAGLSPDPDLARRRYEDAFRRFGFTEIHHVLEPEAAAHFYAQRLTRDATILVGDFGGGTSDFSVMRFRVGGDGVAAEPLGHAGVGIAGDAFDARIIDAVIAPLLGKGSSYRSWDKLLPVPLHYYASFARWNELCLMNAPRTLRELGAIAATATEPAKLTAFIELIEGSVAYELYRAVAATKMALSEQEAAPLTFRSGGIDIAATVRRDDFEGWIAPDLARIEASVDEVLTATGLSADGIDRVFLTGGTSFVPAVRAIFDRRFGAQRVETGEQLLSIAHGLALIGGRTGS